MNTDKSNSVNMHIAFCCDDAYAKHLPPILRSIEQFDGAHATVHFYTVTAEIAESTQKRLLQAHRNVEIISVDPSRYCGFVIPESCNHVTLPTYFRYAITEKLNTLDKVLYLNCDLTIVDSILPLWGIELRDHLAAAAPDSTGMRQKKHHFDRLNITPGDFYFNAGVMLINLKRWRREGISRKLIDYTRHNPEKLAYGDQDVLNHILQGRIIELNLVYNHQETSTESTSISLIHFNGSKKPWHRGYNSPKKTAYLRSLSNAEKCALSF